MRTVAVPQPECPRPHPLCQRVAVRPRSLPAPWPAAAVLIVAIIFSPGAMLAAQTAPPTAAPAQKPAAAHNHPTAAKPAQEAAVSQPKPPDWPANDQPTEAKVVWDSHGLRIVASNSSLTQILKDVSAKTGAALEGLDQDERIFGSYGPGPACDVLSQLLDGSVYYVLMIGDQGQGTPRRIVLSGRSVGAAQPSGNTSRSTASQEDTESEQPSEQQQPEQPQPEQPPAAVREGPAPAVPVRTPAPILEQMQQRQQQLQQQQQQNPQN